MGQQAWTIRQSDFDHQWIIEVRGGETIGRPSADVISAIHKVINLAYERNLRIATLCPVEDRYVVIVDALEP